jgi:hypothetical protein
MPHGLVHSVNFAISSRSNFERGKSLIANFVAAQTVVSIEHVSRPIKPNLIGEGKAWNFSLISRYSGSFWANISSLW